MPLCPPQIPHGLTRSRVGLGISCFIFCQCYKLGGHKYLIAITVNGNSWRQLRKALYETAQLTGSVRCLTFIKGVLRWIRRRKATLIAHVFLFVHKVEKFLHTGGCPEYRTEINWVTQLEKIYVFFFNLPQGTEFVHYCWHFL
jgi:hypothetical protein